MKRSWDGRVREVISVRRVKPDDGTGKTRTLALLECGHEVLKQTGTTQLIICDLCPEWDGRHAGNPRRTE